MFQTAFKNQCSPDLLAKIADVIPSPIVITQAGDFSIYDQRIVYINKAFSDLTGYPLNEVLGRSPEFLCDPRQSSDKMLTFFQNCRANSNFSMHFSSFKRDGTEHNLKIDISPLSTGNENDSPHYILSFTPLSQFAPEQQTTKLEEFTQPAQPQFQPQQPPTQFAPGTEISEHTQQIARNQLQELAAGQTPNFDDAMYDSVVEEIQQSNFAPTAGPTAEPAQASGEPEISAEEFKSGRQSALQEIINSIEKRTAMEPQTNQQTILAKEEAIDKELVSDELDYYAKARFLNSMSHDLRTPLNAIIGFSEVIRDQLFGPIDNPRYISYANDIYKSGQQLLGTVSEILELSEIEEEDSAVEDSEFNLTHTVDEVLELLSAKASQSDVKIAKNLKAKDIAMKGDKLKLKQAIAGILGNAIKASPKNGQLEIATEIADNGNFNLMVYIKSTTLMGTKSNIGALLGTVTSKLESEYPEISLARKYVEAHDGAFKIFNSAVSGTEISINIPASRVSAIKEAKAHLKVIN